MPALELQTALGRLLSDSALRRHFARDPLAAARGMGLEGAEARALAELKHDALESQAQTLVKKRLYEVSKLLPATFSKLGPAGRTHFLDYAETHWPTGHLRHLDDAAAFCRYVTAQRITGVCRVEYHRAAFAASRRRISLHFARVAVAGRVRRALQILYRGRNGTPRQVVLYFGL